MAVKIRLARAGAKGRPYYRIVIADSRSPRDGKYIEKVGSYNPLLPNTSPDRVILKSDRIENWISFGAQPTEVVKRLMKSLGSTSDLKSVGAKSHKINVEMSPQS